MTTLPNSPQSSGFDSEDEHWMTMALDFARAAERAGEVPVGAVLVREGILVAGAGNRPIAEQDPSAHAEILTLRLAGRLSGNYRLPGTTLYVTLEPCVMCAGAIVHGRIDRVVYAARDPRAGAAGSCFDVLNTAKLNHRVRLAAGCRAEEAAGLLRSFFATRRGRLAPGEEGNNG